MQSYLMEDMEWLCCTINIITAEDMETRGTGTSSFMVKIVLLNYFGLGAKTDEISGECRVKRHLLPNPSADIKHNAA